MVKCGGKQRTVNEESRIRKETSNIYNKYPQKRVEGKMRRAGESDGVIVRVHCRFYEYPIVQALPVRNHCIDVHRVYCRLRDLGR